ncbi:MULTISPECIES: TIGR02444 family protein [unclassified Mycobacterium]|uniref:TIGR02444 family protein n=1 Tax=unclassified Mycobacterium TaxID=2642494 RepID=UPI0029C60016|nr:MULTISPECIES: TIGR02444 family protein [unclassified Mycobacterium]
MTERKDAFRKFALDLYGIEGVGPASVFLQERSGVDVNVLLLAAFVGSARGLSFTTEDFESIESTTRPWQNDVVGPLRAVRVRLKNAAPNPAAAELRDRVKAIELDAELIEVDELCTLATTLTTTAAPGDAEQRAMAAMVVVAHESAGREPNHDERTALAVIASAAARFGKE